MSERLSVNAKYRKLQALTGGMANYLLCLLFLKEKGLFSEHFQGAENGQVCKSRTKTEGLLSSGTKVKVLRIKHCRSTAISGPISEILTR